MSKLGDEIRALKLSDPFDSYGYGFNDALARAAALADQHQADADALVAAAYEAAGVRARHLWHDSQDAEEVEIGINNLTNAHARAAMDRIKAELRAEIERLRGLLDEAREGLGYYVDTLCEGFCEDMPDRAYTDQNCELDCSACKARATLAKIGGQND